MHKIFFVLTIIFAFGISAHAQGRTDSGIINSEQEFVSLKSQPPAGYPIVKGVVRQVDRINETIKIKHEEIPNLGMPAMTMTFAVTEASMLDDLASGDKVNFCAEEINGVLTVIWIEKVQ